MSEIWVTIDQDIDDCWVSNESRTLLPIVSPSTAVGRKEDGFFIDVKSQKVEFEKPLVLLSENKIFLFQDTFPSLEAAALILNKLRDQLQVAAVKAPGFGDNRKSILGDLAILTGGTVFTDELGIKLEKATPDFLGSSDSITVTKEDTIVLNGDGSKDAIQARCEQIRALIADPSTSDYDKTKLQER